MKEEIIRFLKERGEKYAENQAGRIQDYLKEHPGETKEKWDISRFHEWNIGGEGK